MRTAIKARLTDELSAIAGRCYDAHEPTSATVKPYATVKLAGQTNGPAWTGSIRTYEIALYTEGTAAVDLDDLAEQAVQALHGVKLTGGSPETGFTCRFEGTAASDQMVETLQTLVHVLKFSVSAVGNVLIPSADVWLDALCGWTAETAGLDWNVYRQQWPQDYTAAPSILWRVGSVGAADQSAATVELNKTMIGHVVGRTEAEQLDMIGTLTSALGGVTRLSIDPVENRHISVGAVAANVNAGAFAEGQLSAAFRQVIQKTVPEGVKVAGVHYDGGFR